MSGTVLMRIDWGLILWTAIACTVGLLFVHSATFDDPEYAGQDRRQMLFLAASAALGAGVMLVSTSRIQRSTWWIYLAVIAALVLLPVFGVTVNGARRWYRLPGFSVQPSEFAKLAVILALAAHLRFKVRAEATAGWVGAIVVTALPAALVLMQPDLGSSLVFWPVMFAVCHAAGVPGKTLLRLAAAFAIGGILVVCFGLHGYQRTRIDTWLSHFAWSDADLATREVREVILGSGYQPWQSLIAIGAGGWTGFGLMQGPQNRYDFLPYRSSDYVFAVVCEETGWLGAIGVLTLQIVLALWVLALGSRCRERFSRLCCVGIGIWLGTQSLMHVAVCAWLVPATGLPMPLISAGGSSTLVAVVAIALAINLCARRQPVLAGDGFD